MNSTYDLIVLGGGPAGATTAYCAARRGLKVLLLEAGVHPRFHIGESFLPRNLQLLQDLGLEERFRALPHTIKRGASFGLGHEDSLTDYPFDSAFNHQREAFNIERAPFDAMLFAAATDAGADCREGARVVEISNIEEGAVSVETLRTDGGREQWHGRYLADASGLSTLLGRKLGSRKTMPDLRKVAYFGHFEKVQRRSGVQGGYPIVVMCRDGWFWLIPIDEKRTSIGLVLDEESSRAAGVPSKEMLAWAIERTPLLRQLAGDAQGPPSNGVAADFSYTCAPFAGPGYFLVGDAATFVDPIFSTGVCLGMMSAVQVADSVHAIFRQGADPAQLRSRYIDYVSGSSNAFFKLVRQYYSHPFRELLLQGQGPLEVHRAVISVLTGDVFPRPEFRVRWRLQFMSLLSLIQRYLPLGPRREEFSLVDSTPSSSGRDS